MSDLRRDVLERQQGSGKPPLGLVRKRPPLIKGLVDFKPTTYENYFDNHRDVYIPNTNDLFRVYMKGFDDNLDKSIKCPLLILLHGGGYSGLTWSCFTKSLASFCYSKILAIDLRGHGSSFTEDENNFSIQTLTKDIGNIYTALNLFEEDQHPPTVVVGHSMGGALAVHCSIELTEIIPGLIGMVVIDVVEGTAMEALGSMRSVLWSRPKSFLSLETAVEWCLRSGMTRNVESARVSMPGQLKNTLTNKVATEEVKEIIASKANEANKEKQTKFVNDNPNQIKENEEQVIKKTPEKPKNPYVWRIDLQNTEPFWEGWFEGLSELFLNSLLPAKLLILASYDRLDKSLTIGQMQGRFQIEYLPRCGHAIHEDDPDGVAELIANFLIRNKLADGVTESL